MMIPEEGLIPDITGVTQKVGDAFVAVVEEREWGEDWDGVKCQCEFIFPPNSASQSRMLSGGPTLNDILDT